MSIAFTRGFRRAAVLCFVVAASLGTVFTGRAAAGTASTVSVDAEQPRTATTQRTGLALEERSLYASAPMTLAADGDRLLAYAPAKHAATPITVVYLHGMHGKAENGCPFVHAGASELGWLVCPEGATPDVNGTRSWGGDVFAQGRVVARALHAAQANGASDEPGVAVGFSQGAYVALDLVKSGQGHFRGLVLLAAPEAHPSAQKLKDAGVVRVALGAGAHDAAHGPLVEDAKRLQREGIETRFFDLGAVGHTYAAEDPAVLRDAIVWASGRE